MFWDFDQTKQGIAVIVSFFFGTLSFVRVAIFLHRIFLRKNQNNVSHITTNKLVENVSPAEMIREGLRKLILLGYEAWDLTEENNKEFPATCSYKTLTSNKIKEVKLKYWPQFRMYGAWVGKEDVTKELNLFLDVRLYDDPNHIGILIHELFQGKIQQVEKANLAEKEQEENARLTRILQPVIELDEITKFIDKNVGQMMAENFGPTPETASIMDGLRWDKDFEINRGLMEFSQAEITQARLEESMDRKQTGIPVYDAAFEQCGNGLGSFLKSPQLIPTVYNYDKVGEPLLPRYDVNNPPPEPLPMSGIGTTISCDDSLVLFGLLIKISRKPYYFLAHTRNIFRSDDNTIQFIDMPNGINISTVVNNERRSILEFLSGREQAIVTKAYKSLAASIRSNLNTARSEAIAFVDHPPRRLEAAETFRDIIITLKGICEEPPEKEWVRLNNLLYNRLAACLSRTDKWEMHSYYGFNTQNDAVIFTMSKTKMTHLVIESGQGQIDVRSCLTPDQLIDITNKCLDIATFCREKYGPLYSTKLFSVSETRNAEVIGKCIEGLDRTIFGN
jgi:hypothetical protein